MRLLVIFLAAIACVLLLKYEDVLLQKWAATPPANQQVLGQLHSSAGAIYVRRESSDEAQEKTSGPLRHRDTLTVPEAIEVALKLHTGDTVQLLGPSSATIERSPLAGSHILITLHRGSYRAQLAGDTSTILIMQDGLIAPLKASSAAEPLSAPEAEAPTDSATDEEDSPETAAETVPGPVPEDIAEVIESQNPWFNKCYSLYLKENPQGRGDMQILFEVSADGRARNGKVFHSTIADNKMQRCVLTVFERIQFLPFDGPSKKVLFPLKFAD